jgi:glycosyltransferase involved in cell wall biosynthesis
VGPHCENEEQDEADLFRVSSIKNFNDTSFPVTIPLPGELTKKLDEFEPQIVHSHFPFIIGSTAMRVAASYSIPLVFTYHTMYERYIHYVNSDSDRIRAFVKKLTAGYSNLCDMVIAPSKAVKEAICERGVVVPVEVIPTGVDVKKMKKGDGVGFRKKYKIAAQTKLLGHLGRLAEEKNLMFLVDAVSRFLRKNPDARFLIVGDGPLSNDIKDFFSENNLSKQVIFTGVLEGQELIDAYHAMDLFVFSSKSETQGMVLAEAMAASLPVIALRATGVTDILRDSINGYMLDKENADLFASKIEHYFSSDQKLKKAMRAKALETAELFSIEVCTLRVLELYEKLIKRKKISSARDDQTWQGAMDIIKAEWDIFCNYISAVGDMITESDSNRN